MSGSNKKTDMEKSKKSKSISPPPFDVKNYLKEPIDQYNNEIINFTNAKSLDEQMVILKNILDNIKNGICDITLKFLVILFFYTESKHPLKGCLARNINKNKEIHKQFTDILSQVILYNINLYENKGDSSYNKDVTIIISKIFSCVENFTPGTEAVMNIVDPLYNFLLFHLKICSKSVSDHNQSALLTEIYNSIQMTLRLFLYVLQKDSNKIKTNFNELRDCIVDTMLYVHMPMDTKSVAAILLLATFDGYKERGWDVILNSDNDLAKEIRQKLMHNDAAKVCIYSAILTTVPIEILQSEVVGDTTVIIHCMESILEVTERCPEDNGIAVCSSRSINYVCTRGAVRAARARRAALAHARALMQHHAHAVRYLAADTLANVVRNSIEKDDSWWQLCISSDGLCITSRVYHACVRAACGAALRRVRRALPAPAALLHALADQHVQAQATSALEAYIEKYCLEGILEDVNNDWIIPILKYVTENSPESPVITILENLLVKAIKVNEGVLKFIKHHMNSCNEEVNNLKCTLMLLNVARKCNAFDKLRNENQNSDAWNGVISYDVLEMALFDEDDENRLLSLGAIIDNVKSGIPWSARELSLVLNAVITTAGEPSPPVRDRMFALLEKFTKRFAEGYRWLLRQNVPNSDVNKADYYLEFIEDLREQCYLSLLPGVNYTRRYVILKLLSWIECMDLEGYNRTWKEDYADTLLLHLDDSYENNKELALQILGRCPKDILQKCRLSSDIQLDSILKRACSLKPTDSVTAAYQLEALITLLPERVYTEESESPRQSVLRQLLHQSVSECDQWREAVCPRAAPLFTTLHLINSVLQRLDERSAREPAWQRLLLRVCAAGGAALDAVLWAVCVQAPEGNLPEHCRRRGGPDAREVSMTDDGPVTSQMLLLCAWRTVKEATSCMSVASDLSLDIAISRECGERVFTALTEMQHRGAVELAAKGFTSIMHRICRECPQLAERWLHSALQWTSDAPAHAAAPTRRGAGLPFIIQSIVLSCPPPRGTSTAQLVLSHVRDACACAAPAVRTHALLVARALVQKLPLAVPDAIYAALMSLDAETFPERNAATLLWSATMCRIFGPNGEHKMSAYEFFHRYPHLYNIILDRLSIDWNAESEETQTSVAALLLLLARLYPSPDGSLTDVKLDSFAALVSRVCDSRSALLRRLAARALPAVLTQDRYIEHIIKSLQQYVVSPHNSSEGMLLQASALVEKLDSITGRGAAVCSLRASYCVSLDMYSCNIVCYTRLQRHAALTHALINKFPDIMDDETMNKIEQCLSKLIFTENIQFITIGREICLSYSLYIYYYILDKRSRTDDIVSLIYTTLDHNTYEVVLTTFNYLLLRHKENDLDLPFKIEINDTILNELRKNDTYINKLKKILKENKYLECKHKCLKLLSYEDNTQLIILGCETLNDSEIIMKFIEKIDIELDILTHVYLKSLTDFVADKLVNNTFKCEDALIIMRLMLEYSSSKHDDEVRHVVVTFIENNIDKLMEFDQLAAVEGCEFEFIATRLSTLAVLLGDSCREIRQRVSRVCGRVCRPGASGPRASEATVSGPRASGSGLCGPRAYSPRACGPAVGCLLRTHVANGTHALPLLVTLALLDFQSEVRYDTDFDAECRVFDQSERYNVYLEESIWTNSCAESIIQKFTRNDIKLIDYIYSVICDSKYVCIERLCNDNVKIFKKYIKEGYVKNNVNNPKIELFYRKLISI